MLYKLECGCIVTAQDAPYWVFAACTNCGKQYGDFIRARGESGRCALGIDVEHALEKQANTPVIPAIADLENVTRAPVATMARVTMTAEIVMAIRARVNACFFDVREAYESAGSVDGACELLVSPKWSRRHVMAKQTPVI
jgi:hypothetical protein